jgi:hypothetical protein
MQSEPFLLQWIHFKRHGLRRAWNAQHGWQHAPLHVDRKQGPKPPKLGTTPSLVSTALQGCIWASVLAISCTLLVQIFLKASHAPAAATALLISLGLFQPTWSDAGIIIFGVLITAFIGEPLRRIRLAQPGQK